MKKTWLLGILLVGHSYSYASSGCSEKSTTKTFYGEIKKCLEAYKEGK